MLSPVLPARPRRLAVAVAAVGVVALAPLTADVSASASAADTAPSARITVKQDIDPVKANSRLRGVLKNINLGQAVSTSDATASTVASLKQMKNTGGRQRTYAIGNGACKKKSAQVAICQTSLYYENKKAATVYVKVTGNEAGKSVKASYSASM